MHVYGRGDISDVFRVLIGSHMDSPQLDLHCICYYVYRRDFRSDGFQNFPSYRLCMGSFHM